MRVTALAPTDGNPCIEDHAKEIDNRINGHAITFYGPAGHITFIVVDREPVTVSVPPLDFLEFRARLPLATPQGINLLKDFTAEETMVALALWHLERSSYSSQEIGNNATVQPGDVMFVVENLREWVQIFDRARALLSSHIRTNSDA